jgi:plasmid stabilization system protein ParE
MYSVTISGPAEQDLDAALDYFLTVLNAPQAAQTLLNEIEEKIIFLQTNPLVYEIEHDDYLRERNIRSVLVRSHLIFYFADPQNEEVFIIRILYARRNWLNILRSNL